MHVSIKKLEQAEGENTQSLEFMEEDTTGDFLSATREMLDPILTRGACVILWNCWMETNPEDVKLSEYYRRTVFPQFFENSVGCPHPLPTKIIFSFWGKKVT